MQTNDWSSYEELAGYFFRSVVERIVSSSQISATAEYIKELVGKGWKVEDIKNEVDLFAKEYPEMVKNVYTLQQIMTNKQPPSNLIEDGAFYYHNRLRITSKPVRLKKNNETGRMERIEEPFFLEMVKVFNMDHLLEYWYTSNDTIPNESSIRRDKGRFEYLLGYYDIEEILFMIDIAQDNRKMMNQKLLKNAFDLEKYIEDAKQQIKLKRSIARTHNVNKVIEKAVEK